MVYPNLWVLTDHVSTINVTEKLHHQNVAQVCPLLLMQPVPV